MKLIDTTENKGTESKFIDTGKKNAADFDNCCTLLGRLIKQNFCQIEIFGLDGHKKNEFIDKIFANIDCVPYPHRRNEQRRACLDQFGEFSENIVLLGLPGGGKSTLIKRLLFYVADSMKNLKLIPIFLELKNEFTPNNRNSEFFKKLIDGNRSIEQFQEYATYLYNKLRTRLGDSFFAKLYETSPESEIEYKRDDAAEWRYVFFCDGLDEISAEDYTTFNSFVNSVVCDSALKQKVKFFISSRYQGFKLNDYQSDFMKYSLLGLNVQQILDYVDKYFNLYNKTSSPECQALRQAVKENELVQEMANSPILLSLLCVVKDINEINDRTTLFEQAIMQLLTEHGKIGDDDIDAIKHFLQTIAVCFFKQDKLENFEKEELQYFAQKLLSEKLQNKYLHCGLFDENTDPKKGGYKFYHRTIWEYLVAKGMLDRPEDEIYERAEMKTWTVPIKMWVIMFAKIHDGEQARIADMFNELWKHNKALTLECLSEYKDSDAILTMLYNAMDKRQKLRLIGTLRETYVNAPDFKAQAVEMVVKSLRLIHQKERDIGKDCEVIYQYVAFLEEFSSEPKFDALLDEIFEYSKLAERLNRLAEVGLRFISVRPGAYEMGRDKFAIPQEESREKYISIDEEETPKHRVKITKEFQISQTLVTNEMFYRCGFPFASQKHGYNSVTQSYNNSYSPTDTYPVNYVTWYEAIVFAKWLKCTLPTEAEWEYACLGCGEETDLLDIKEQSKLRSYLAGYDIDAMSDDNNPDMVCFCINKSQMNHHLMRAHYSYAGNTTMPRKIFEVGRYEIDDDDIRRNKLGLIDMLGNLREWCLDWFSEDFYLRCDIANYPSFSHDIVGKATVSYTYDRLGNMRLFDEINDKDLHEDVYTFDSDGYCLDPIKKYISVAENKCIRGGCYDWNVTNLRPSYRNHNPATNIYKVNGFRLVKKN